MSSFNVIGRNALIALLLLAPAVALSSCTMSPVYSNAKASKLVLDYPEPTGRLDQILYQDLARSFPEGGDRKITVTVSASPRGTTTTATSRLGSTLEMRATGTLTIKQGDEILLQATRYATATYESYGQSIANATASQNAQDQAVHALAEEFRLTILATLGT